MANTKKTVGRPAGTKKTNNENNTVVTKKNVAIEEDKVIVNEPVKEVKKEAKKYNTDDFILCRSVVYGELVYSSQKSGILYSWSQYGDETEVQYADLQALYLTKSPYLFNPWIIVEDQDLVSQWSKLEELYRTSFKYEDTDSILSLSADELTKALTEMPVGMRDSFKTGVADKIEDGTLDSIRTIRIIDKVLGTDFHCLFE